MQSIAVHTMQSVTITAYHPKSSGLITHITKYFGLHLIICKMTHNGYNNYYVYNSITSDFLMQAHTILELLLCLIFCRENNIVRNCRSILIMKCPGKCQHLTCKHFSNFLFFVCFLFCNKGSARHRVSAITP